MFGESTYSGPVTLDRWFVGPGQDIRFSLTLSDITIEDPITQNFPFVAIGGVLNTFEGIQLDINPLDANDERQPENAKFPYSVRFSDDSIQDLGIEWSPGDRISIRMNNESFFVEINGVEVATQEVLSQLSCNPVRFNLIGQNRFGNLVMQDPDVYSGPGTIVFNGISIEVTDTPS